MAYILYFGDDLIIYAVMIFTPIGSIAQLGVLVRACKSDLTISLGLFSKRPTIWRTSYIGEDTFDACRLELLLFCLLHLVFYIIIMKMKVDHQKPLHYRLWDRGRREK